MATYKSRGKGGIIEFENHKDELDKLKKLFSEMDSKHAKPLSVVTATNYTNKLNKLSTLVTGHGFDGTYEWLNDTKKVIGAVSQMDGAGKKDLFSPVIRLLKHFEQPLPVIEEYQRAMSGFKDDESKIRNLNVASDKQVEASLPYSEILKKINAYKPIDDMTLIYKLICSLYFQNSLVPRNDLPLMKFVSSSKKPRDMNEAYNYITLDKNGTPLDIIMNHYKTRNTYGRQRFQISKPTQALLKEYIRSYGKKAGDFLFVMSDGTTPFSKPNFLGLIKNATDAVFGKKLTIDGIRSIQITDYYNGRAKSIAEDETDSTRYLHGSQVHRQYIKTNFKHEDDDDDD